MKLSGTALTLLGGLGPWYAQYPACLNLVLGALSHALGAPDEKLSRNAATCVKRLRASDELCRVLCERHGAWIDSLLHMYQQLAAAAAQQGECGACEMLAGMSPL